MEKNNQRKIVSSIIALARPRTWIFASLAFFFGYLITGSWEITYLILGIIIFMLLSAAVNLVNAYYDRFEDKINQPIRTEMLEAIGLRNMKILLIGIYSVAIFLSMWINLMFFIVALIAVFDSIFYSAPPLRFKKNMLVGMIAFSGAIAIPFVAGWVINKPIWELSPMFYLITYFFFTYFSVKNIPDFLGDKKAKVKTVMTRYNKYEKGVYISFFILFTPYVLLLVLLILNMLSGVYYTMYILIPVLLYLLKENLQHENNLPRLERLHTYGFLYSVTFLNIILFLSVLSIETIVWIAFSYFYLLFFMKLRYIDSRHEESQGMGKN
ncbi:MAG: UbiA family prenyltransferase [Promethearchaeota archaeon]